MKKQENTGHFVFEKLLSASCLGLLLLSPSSFAGDGCNRHCLEKLLAQITTLREEVKKTIPIGTILPFSGNSNLPEGYLLCDGSPLEISKYPELYAVIGLTYSKTPPPAETEIDISQLFDPSNNPSPLTQSQLPEVPTVFNLPDLRGRTTIGAGQGQATLVDSTSRTSKTVNLAKRTLGEQIGEERHLLTIDELPTHNHTVTDKGHNHTLTDPGHAHSPLSGNFLAWPQDSGPMVGGFLFNGANVPCHSNTAKANTGITIASTTTGITIDNTGKSRQHNVMQPSLVIRYMIKAK